MPLANASRTILPDQDNDHIKYAQGRHHIRAIPAWSLA